MNIANDPVVMYLVVNKRLGLSPGKIAAQIGHCVEKISSYHEDDVTIATDDYCYSAYIEKENLNKRLDDYQEYKDTGTTKIVLGIDDPPIWAQLKELTDFVVVDEGRTECAPNSETVIGFFPMHKSIAPDVIKGLKLL